MSTSRVFAGPFAPLPGIFPPMARAKPAPLRYETIERAPSGRGRCGECGAAIAKGDLRLRLGWTSGFVYTHLDCAARSRERAHWLVRALDGTVVVSDRDALRARAAELARAVQEAGRARWAAEDARHEGVPTADRIAATHAGTCLQCRGPVEEGALGVLEANGVLHLGCALPWAERRAGRPVESWLQALFENTAGLTDEDQAAVERTMRA